MLVVAVVLIVVWLAVLAVAFYFFTNTLFLVELSSGVWWFAIALTLALGTGVVWVALALHGRHGSLTRRSRRLASLSLLFITFALAAVSVGLGIKFRPFRMDNIRFGAFMTEALWSLPLIDYTNLPAAKSALTYEEHLPVSIDQGTCGNCWAMAAAAMISARYSMYLQRKGLQSSSSDAKTCPTGGADVSGWFASPQFLTNADVETVTSSSTSGLTTYVGKCGGSAISTGLQIASTHGVPPMSCVPYYAGLSPDCSKCDAPGSKVSLDSGSSETYCIRDTSNAFIQEVCADGTTKVADTELMKVKNVQRMNSAEAMMREISANGPIFSAIAYYRKRNGGHSAWTLSDAGGYFAKYVSSNFVARPEMDGDQYDDDLNAHELHALVIFGYGETEDGVPYWDVFNSWGNRWGVEGTCKIERGVNAWGIETFAVSAALDTTGLRGSTLAELLQQH